MASYFLSARAPAVSLWGHRTDPWPAGGGFPWPWGLTGVSMTQWAGGVVLAPLASAGGLGAGKFWSWWWAFCPPCWAGPTHPGLRDVIGLFCLAGAPTTPPTPPPADPCLLPPAVIPPSPQQASVSLTMGSLWDTRHVLCLLGEGPSG